MTQPLSPDRPDPLAPVAAALLDRAHRDADAMLAAADAAAAATLAAARDEAVQLRALALEKGAADGAAVLANERSRAERTARGVVMAARRAADDRLRQAARDAVSDLRSDPSYPRILAGLRARATRERGASAVISEYPRGGIVAEADGTRVEYSLDGLADDVMDRLEAADEWTWSL